jgi:DNA-binding NarL/FixJ family response regulator
MTVTVVLAEDNLLVREGIAALLRGSASDVENVAQCDSLESALTAIERHDPDVVVTDIRMPPGNSEEGIRLAEMLRERHPGIGVVLLSNYSSPVYALALLDGGSEGRAYLLKERVHDGDQLRSAIHAVAVGGSVIDPKVVQPLMASRARGERSPLADLTAREREVLAQIAEGKSNAAIAESLVLTKRAVEKHINAIFMKLGLAGAEDEVSKRVKSALMFLAELDRRG